MINWKTFKEKPKVGSHLLVLINGYMFSSIAADTVISHNEHFYLIDDLEKQKAQWEYIDQLQSKQPNCKSGKCKPNFGQTLEHQGRIFKKLNPK